MINLETSRLIIRDHVPEDLHNLHNLMSNNEVMHFLDFKTNSFYESEKELELRLEESQKTENRRKYYFALILKSDNSYIGEIGFSILQKMKDTGICNFGFFIQKLYWNKGYITEATKKLIEFIFTELSLHKIETGCISINSASERVMIKCGFKKEAELLEHTFIDGKWYNRLEYGLLKKDWLEKSASSSYN